MAEEVDTGQAEAVDADSTQDAEAPLNPLDGTDLDAARTELIEWYETGHREFPWRETTDPYEILVSEVMSQQTQLDRVVDAWADFLDRWPTVDALAAADRADVVGFWTDHRLGYNNRARYLHEAAEQVVDGDVDGVESGEFPTDPDGLAELMGVGPYTANAVASFAFNDGDAVVDTNVKRVLYRAFDVADDDGAFEQAAQQLMPASESRVWNNAIMELGGVACEQSPRCDETGCPWRARCSAYASGDFTAPDVPTQPAFDGSRRQFRGRIVRTLQEHGEQSLDDLGPRVRVDYAPQGDGEGSRAWLEDLLADLADDGLLTVSEDDGEPVARLRE
jgi:A/G-specific adenine glycosylase